MSFSLFVNFCFFDFKDFDSVKGGIYQIEKKFYNLKKSNICNVTEFEKKILDKNDNSKIFYCGIEQDIVNKYKDFYDKNIKEIKNFFYPQEIEHHKLDKFLVKTKLKLNYIGGKSLLSLLVIFEIMNYNNDSDNYNDDVYNVVSKNYYLFPLEFKDFHK